MENDLNSPAPLGELESDAFVYTTPKKNLNASNYTGGLEQFANDLDTFASSMNGFYGRDSEDGKHRMFTYKTCRATNIVSPTMCRSPSVMRIRVIR